ncbi:MAG: DUF3592 domain-containing protein [Desulfobacterales bacterium]|jgi:hypothetical protein|nr:DUF3592 domain-containing protein [Desulfobacteraceae bacterium]MBT4365700.1 DUF3592 domain-containing protein [Desulfobacteraceae bacterium]MBT7086066.1 DUF3592 domain-containing protein [Desulfobacterales bacterium]MBT7697307.1 DUF3592 domain-containing protein [Desulfobacterales bacterium]
MKPEAILKATLGLYISLFFVVVFFAIAGFFYFKASATKSWPVTKGVIETSRVEKKVISSRSSSTSYYPEVFYKYVVNENEYSGFSISYMAPSYSNYKDAEKHAGKYPEGAVVDVYYNQEQDDSAIIETGISLSDLKIFLIPGTILLLLSLIIIIRLRFVSIDNMNIADDE